MDTDVPQAPQIRPDPMFDRLQSQASANEATATQAIATGDLASLMARYGSLLALAGTKGTSPLLASPIVKSSAAAGQVATK